MCVREILNPRGNSPAVFLSLCPHAWCSGSYSRFLSSVMTSPGEGWGFPNRFMSLLVFITHHDQADPWPLERGP